VKLGLFGGTFDPPHYGHLIVAQDAALALGLDRILFVPAAVPPHKMEAAVTPAVSRLRMLELATADDPRFGIETVELDREGPSFTVDTLRSLRKAHPADELVLLVGADQFAEFSTWREPDEIRRLAGLAVLSRAGSVPAGRAAGTTEPAPGVVELDGGAVAVAVTRIDISSTMVRGRVAAGLPVRYLVPVAVEQYIAEHRLYGRNGPTVPGYNPGHPE
jgi:nicotinate-nucleotide adenylyltransferase